MRIDAFAMQMLQATRRPERDVPRDEQRGRRGGSPDEDDAPAEAQGAGTEWEECRQPFVMPKWNAPNGRRPVEERQTFSDALLAQASQSQDASPAAHGTADERCGRAAGPSVASADLFSFLPPPATRQATSTPTPRSVPSFYRREEPVERDASIAAIVI